MQNTTLSAGGVVMMFSLTKEDPARSVKEGGKFFTAH
jgi:hypothetical protein